MAAGDAWSTRCSKKRVSYGGCVAVVAALQQRSAAAQEALASILSCGFTGVGVAGASLKDRGVLMLYFVLVAWSVASFTSSISTMIVERVQQQERARHQAHVDMLKERQHAVERTQVESVLHCRRCASSNLNFVQLQLRSADEPMTLFYRCTSCAHNWRENG